MNCEKCNHSMKRIVLFSSVEYECPSCSQPQVTPDNSIEPGLWVRITGGAPHGSCGEAYKGKIAVVKSGPCICPFPKYHGGKEEWREWMVDIGEDCFQAVPVESKPYNDYHQAFFERVTPLKGEWWVKLACSNHGPWGANPFQFKENFYDSMRDIHRHDVIDLIRCGCLIPHNFGKGDSP